MNTLSFNRLVLASYAGERTLKADETSGFARLTQKVSVVGLKVLVDAKLRDGITVSKGSTAYIREELLFTQEWAKKNMESPAIEGKFILVDPSNIEFVVQT